jgi:hypothetical protein
MRKHSDQRSRPSRFRRRHRSMLVAGPGRSTAARYST